jgi:hypothetical protein
MRITTQRLLLVVMISCAAHASNAQGLGSLETEDLRLLYFEPTQSFLKSHVARSFENSMERQRFIFDYEPDEKITTLLTDFSDYGNAAATAVPRNTLMFEVSPISTTFETFTASERFYMLMNHELVHIITMDQATNADKKIRRFFGGKVSPKAEHPETILYTALTTPRVLAPGWYLEGSAVFLETWLAGGVGRAQGAYDEMVFRSMVRDESHFYDPLGLVSEGTKIDFMVGVNDYLYGTRFISYLAYNYEPEMVISWIGRKEGSRRSYRKQFEQVFGLPIAEAWQNWIEWEHKFQQSNLESIRKYPTTPLTDLTDRAFGSVSRAFYDPAGNRLYAGFRYPGVVAHVGALSLDDGSIEKFEDIKGPMLFRVTSPAFAPDSNTLFYTADNTAYRDLMSFDIETGKSERLIRDSRIGDLVYNSSDKSLWGVRHLNGIATLVRIPYPYKEWNQILSFDYGQVLTDLDISPDGNLLSASFSEISGDQSLRVIPIDSLLNKDATPLRQFDFGLAVPEGFVFSPDGKYLFGSSYYTGVSNIYRYELATGDIEAVSNVETGLFRPIPLDDGSLIAFRFSGEGFIPVRIDPQPIEDIDPIVFLGHEVISKHPQLEEWKVGSAADIPLDDLITHEGKYSGISNLGFESIYPIIEGYKDEFALGVNAAFSDSLGLDSINFSASHSIDSSLPSSEDLHAQIEWRHIVAKATPLAGMWTMALRHNPADFYDLFGPTKQALKGQSASVTYEKTLVYDRPREMHLIVDLSHYTGLDRLPRYQNIDVTFDTLSTFGARLDYSRVRKSLGAVDDEKGFTWTLGATADHVDGDTIPKVLAEFDFGFALPWRHSSIWIRNSAGAAFGEPLDEFANFFFGGFGNNYVDHQEVKRYREYYSMPGFELNAIPGRNFHRAMLEWTLPPIRFKNVGGPSFYLTWVRTALFASNLTTNLDNDLIKLDTQSYGIQIDFRFTLLSRLNMTLSTGYAKAYGNNSFTDDEWMVSLKIL